MRESKMVWLLALVIVAVGVPSSVCAQVDLARAYYFVGGAPLLDQTESHFTKSETMILSPSDGTFESGFTFARGEVVQFAQFFPFPSENGRLLAFEACFYSYGGEIQNFQFEFQYFSAGSEDFSPGTLRDSRESGVFSIGSV